MPEFVPSTEWLTKSAHKQVGWLVNEVLNASYGWVGIEGLRKRKKAIIQRFPGVPRVGDTLHHGRPTRTGQGTYRVVRVEGVHTIRKHHRLGRPARPGSWGHPLVGTSGSRRVVVSVLFWESCHLWRVKSLVVHAIPLGRLKLNWQAPPVHSALGPGPSAPPPPTLPNRLPRPFESWKVGRLSGQRLGLRCDPSRLRRTT
jgi:hypothetical protein